MGIVPNPETRGKNYLGYDSDPWEKVYASEINDIQAQAYAIAASRSWQPAKAYLEGDICFPSLDKGKSAMFLECTVAGTTGSTEPTWGNIGDNQTDGGVTWLIKKLGSGDGGGGGLPIGTTIQHLGTTPPDGFLALNGAEVGRATYSELWNWIQNNSGLLVSEADWQTAYNLNSGNCGSYSDGDGTTTFRLPNVAAFLRPKGNSNRDVGDYELDAIRNIEGFLSTMEYSLPGGCFERISTGGGGSYNNPVNTYKTQFNASLVVPTADENRPKNITVLFCVKAFDSAVNQGTIDITELANDVATNASKINDIENALEDGTGFTIIYPNGGTEASPANVTVNQRIVMDNPFPGRHVSCQAQLLCGGEWGSGLFIYSSGSLGTRASHLLPDDKVVLQTGTNYIRAGASANDGGTWSNTLSLTVAPCRILITKLGAI